MSARLTIVLGAGGVGKTTLSAGLGLAHARAGARAGLLGVDPARRLRSALGLDLAELGTRVFTNGTGALDAAILDPSASLRRWIADSCAPDARDRVLASPVFLALADRLAGLTDAVGLARAVEWRDTAAGLDELVLDTAPGLAAIELLARPRKLLAMFSGPVLRWLVRLARVGSGGRVLSRLGAVTGTSVLHDAGDLLGALDAAVDTLVARLERAREWLADPSTTLVIVCGVRDDAAAVTSSLLAALRDLSLAPSLVVLNRALPDALATWSPPAGAVSEGAAFARYIANYARTQAAVRARLADLGQRVLAIPESAELEAHGRLDGLAHLGEPLRAALDSPGLRAAAR